MAPSLHPGLYQVPPSLLNVQSHELWTRKWSPSKSDIVSAYHNTHTRGKLQGGPHFIVNHTANKKIAHWHLPMTHPKGNLSSNALSPLTHTGAIGRIYGGLRIFDIKAVFTNILGQQSQDKHVLYQYLATTQIATSYVLGRVQTTSTTTYIYFLFVNRPFYQTN